MNDFNEYKKYPKMIQWLFKALKEIVEFFNSPKTKSNKLFREIRKGRFAYSPVNKSDETLYSRTTLGTKLYADSVKLITSIMIEESGILNLDRDADLESFDVNKKLKQRVKDKISEIHQEVAEAYTNAVKIGDQRNKMKYESFLLNFNALTGWNSSDNSFSYEEFNIAYESAKYKIALMGLTERKDDDFDDDPDAQGRNGNVDYKASLEYSGKDNATGNVKLIVSLLRNPNKENQSFGVGEFIEIDKVWGKLSEDLAGIRTLDGMIQALDDKKDESPFYPSLIARVNASPLYKKVQFFNAFSKHPLVFIQKLSKKKGKNHSTRVVNADTANIARDNLKKWNSSLVKGFNAKGKLSSAQIVKYKAAINDYIVLSNKIERIGEKEKKGIPVTNSNIVEVFNELKDVYRNLGLNLSDEGFSSLLSHYSGNGTPIDKLYRALFFISDAVGSEGRKTGISLYNMVYNKETDYSEEKNWLNDWKTIAILAKINAEASPLPSKHMVRIAGKDYYSKGQNNFMTKKTQLLKEGLIDHHDDIYHKHSAFYERMSDKDKEGNEKSESEKTIARKNRDGFQVAVFAQDKFEDQDDLGSVYKELVPKDDLITRMSMVFNGVGGGRKMMVSGMTFADKPSWFFMMGLEMATTKGKDVTDVAEEFVKRYVVAEAERINYLVRNKNDKESKSYQ
jgi:hypothetical protein